MPHRAVIFLVFLLAASFLPPTVSPASAGVLAVSTFDSGTEGWTAITLDAAGNIFPGSVSLAPGLGNAGGALRLVAPSEGRTSYFAAPSSFLNALHGAVGGSISWDLSTINEPADIFFTDIDIEIRAGANRLRRSVTPPSPPISPTYVRNTLTFGTGAGWVLFNGSSTAPANQDQINAVISGADALYIRGEYWSSVNPDTGLLDNPTIVGPGLGVVLNRSVAVAGDLVEMRTVGSLPGQVVDLYVVVALPQSFAPALGCGGSIPLVFISNGGTALTPACASGPPNTFPRYTGGTTVSAGTLFGTQWPGAASSGTYTFAVVVTPPGALADGVLGPTDISTIASAQLTVP